jgi:UDP-2-acetamido-2,6-beta-L-arabino-hexul-4-ose reductase
MEGAAMKILVTGSAGFLGRNLLVALRRMDGVELYEFDREHDLELLIKQLTEVEFVYHLAGINRPKDDSEFQKVNVDLTNVICERLAGRESEVPLVFSSSIQAEVENPYGISKRVAEDVVFRYGEISGAPVFVFRLLNLFGKWGQPNYNSVVTTFCYNIARGIPVRVDNPDSAVLLNYVDDVVAHFISLLDEGGSKVSTELHQVEPVYSTTVGDLKKRLESYHSIHENLYIPDMNEPLNRVLYPTYLSYLPEDKFSTAVDLKTDDRGWLFELLKTPHLGQIFISTTHPGITRGDHYHDTKIEKFCVVSGKAIIRFRQIEGDKIIEYPVNGDQPEVVDIPPGYTHSIENTGDKEMICLFWAGAIFDQANPDTFYTKVVDDK